MIRFLISFLGSFPPLRLPFDDQLNQFHLDVHVVCPKHPWARVSMAASSLSPETPKTRDVPCTSEDLHRGKQRRGKKSLPSTSSQCPFLPRADRAAPSPKSLVGEVGGK